jgi:hypothetical protein
MAKRASGSVLQAILLGGVTAATLDLIAADLIYRADLISVMKGIASGWFGPAGPKGGADMALIGLASHYGILIVAAAVFVAASLRAPALRRWWWLTGPLFGAGVYVVMHYAVVPLSHSRGRPPQGLHFYEELASHLFCVGLTIAWWARRILGR